MWGIRKFLEIRESEDSDHSGVKSHLHQDRRYVKEVSGCLVKFLGMWDIQNFLAVMGRSDTDPQDRELHRHLHHSDMAFHLSRHFRSYSHNREYQYVDIQNFLAVMEWWGIDLQYQEHRHHPNHYLQKH